ncbi:uncharacterized protein LAESUDRAFT_710780 [Laetiporus sulphureus 93-53]|uniref:Transmembrane protein n=1 Tax=Laetiporus sulphureus 93-53 TaxID=1314785 RepID=A0A165H3E8_9APHY|nr:uncharacterized protein LAESUDRAFT_710780 [Laetiporus sulphureus 93-53]KZT11190.1 hypothetical protein LAESUDRAFT_710780 [Laetiporus sulphureus 93-53]
MPVLANARRSKDRSTRHVRPDNMVVLEKDETVSREEPICKPLTASAIIAVRSLRFPTDTLVENCKSPGILATSDIHRHIFLGSAAVFWVLCLSLSTRRLVHRFFIWVNRRLLGLTVPRYSGRSALLSQAIRFLCLTALLSLFIGGDLGGYAGRPFSQSSRRGPPRLPSARLGGRRRDEVGESGQRLGEELQASREAKEGKDVSWSLALAFDVGKSEGLESVVEGSSWYLTRGLIHGAGRRCVLEVQAQAPASQQEHKMLTSQTRKNHVASRRIR